MKIWKTLFFQVRDMLQGICFHSPKWNLTSLLARTVMLENDRVNMHWLLKKYKSMSPLVCLKNAQLLSGRVLCWLTLRVC